MIDAEVARYVQSEIDKRLSKVMERIVKIEESMRISADEYLDPTVPLTFQQIVPSIPDWSNHDASRASKWTRKNDTTLVNRIGIQWPVKNLDERHLKEIQADDPDLYAELVPGIQLEHEQENPSRAADPGA
jgi:hypothetical protein